MYLKQHSRANAGLPAARSEISGPHFLENFKTISEHFCRFHEAQDTENARFSVLMLVIEADQYCSPKNVTKAMLHIKQYNVTRENIT